MPIEQHQPAGRVNLPRYAFDASYRREITARADGLRTEQRDAITQIADSLAFQVAGMVHPEWQALRLARNGEILAEGGTPKTTIQNLDMTNEHDREISARLGGATTVDMLQVGWEYVPQRIQDENANTARLALVDALTITEGDPARAEQLVQEDWGMTKAEGGYVNYWVNIKGEMTEADARQKFPTESPTMQAMDAVFYRNAVRLLADSGTDQDLTTLRHISHDVHRYDRFATSTRRGQMTP